MVKFEHYTLRPSFPSSRESSLGLRERMSVLDSVDGATLARIRADGDVMGRARTKQFALEIYLAELIQLRSMAERVLILIDQNSR